MCDHQFPVGTRVTTELAQTCWLECLYMGAHGLANTFERESRGLNGDTDYVCAEADAFIRTRAEIRALPAEHIAAEDRRILRALVTTGSDVW